ncbi:unnamed protein product (macronuclear) [Paramecium tetraurelia]|uniref:Tc1-like transposase DDE domain-containing protein n=1 Tax=Paramecium tetraurelia TaxID=5888 RepID=A0C3A6_PARTE|nr:uncharacterized protein GSPATT00034752001 [Paramecium tetraurelia]CAK65273.1 unnamed protein product [Paramecium tetraurelia]|eukprot:XP_001432670.1 hypothetical protein (macronuclear) [Paramecium tetraurelia strain d4-2]
MFSQQQFLLILDNSPIHKSKKVRKLLIVVRNNFLPPYSPQLNPIEKLWHLLKQHIYKNITTCSSEMINQFISFLENLRI